jgi:hypothetical protein
MRKKSDPASQTIRVQQKRLTVVNAEGRTLPIKSRYLRRRTKGGAKSAAKKLFVGGPSWGTTDEGLGQAFAVHLNILRLITRIFNDIAYFIFLDRNGGSVEGWTERRGVRFMDIRAQRCSSQYD